MTMPTDLHQESAPPKRSMATGDGSAAEAAWMTREEKGTVFGIRVMVWTTRLLGRRGAGVILRIVVFYYALFAGAARRASASYLARVGRPSGFWSVYRHVFAFARCALDRIHFVRGDIAPFEITCTGRENLFAAQKTGKGAILLGAHMGSFEAMRAMGDTQSFKINILAYWENARRISAVLGELGAGFHTRVIPIRPGDPSYVFAARDAIERGEFVAVLGDRVGIGERTVTADFLGAPARFPAGPYTLAAVLRCPVLFTAGLYSAPNRYDLYCEPLSERIELPRGDRERAMGRYAQQYAEKLERCCRQAPDNWFNFFDFWGAE